MTDKIFPASSPDLCSSLAPKVEVLNRPAWAPAMGVSRSKIIFQRMSCRSPFLRTTVANPASCLPNITNRHL